MADQNGKQQTLEQFRNIAKTDENRARFFLDMASWNLDLALANFFENNENSDSEVPVRPKDPTPEVAKPKPPSVAQGAHGTQGAHGAGARPVPTSKIASLNTLRSDDKSDESSEEEGQAYYAGGSERTGQQILGPPKKKNDPNKLISSLFSAAKQHGAEEVEADEAGATASAAPRVAAFQGRAYRLGDPTTESEVIEAPQIQQKRKIDVTLKLWKNGFSLDDGPLREFSDPRNIAFLSAVRQNQVPRELVEQAKGGEVGLSMEDHRDEDFVPPKKVLQSFGGVGHRLGSPTDAVHASSGVIPSSSAQQQSASASASMESSAAENIAIDPSKPTTSLQIRLSDGSRLVAKFNHTHRVSDVRRYIIDARPQLASANFVLMTTFPNKEVTDESQTLASANLLNAVLVQKLK